MSPQLLPILLIAAPLLQGDRLYTVGGGLVRTLDSSTGLVLDGPTIVTGTKTMIALAFDGRQLIAHDNTIPASTDNNWVRFHPADSKVDLLGSTTENWNTGVVAMDYDPKTQEVYAFYGQDAYRVDTSTGAFSHISFLSGLPQFHCICAVAFLPDGSAYATNLGFAQTTLYKIDMVTLHATAMGPLQMAVIGDVLDLAFDSTGQLWGATGSAFFTIDPVNLTTQFRFPSPGSPGIAFGPSNNEVTYCQPKTNSLGCVPDLEPQGLASPTADSGYVVSATNVRNRTMGRLIYSVNGAASLPFAGGTLCVNAPWNGTPIVKSGGSAKPAQDCSGTWSYDLNTHFTNNPGPQAGDVVHCQWIGRDRGFAAPNNYALTAGLEFTLVP